MQTVTVDKSKLMRTLQKNRKNHRQIFEDALDGWKRALIGALERAVKEAKEGSDYKTFFDLKRPEDHTEDYDYAIGMLRMHVGETVELSEGEYRELVVDNWGWKRSFTATAQAYAVS